MPTPAASPPVRSAVLRLSAAHQPPPAREGDRFYLVTHPRRPSDQHQWKTGVRQCRTRCPTNARFSQNPVGKDHLACAAWLGHLVHSKPSSGLPARKRTALGWSICGQGTTNPALDVFPGLDSLEGDMGADGAQLLRTYRRQCYGFKNCNCPTFQNTADGADGNTNL
jgi:hypothetical protein